MNIVHVMSETIRIFVLSSLAVTGFLFGGGEAKDKIMPGLIASRDPRNLDTHTHTQTHTQTQQPLLSPTSARKCQIEKTPFAPSFTLYVVLGSIVLVLLVVRPVCGMYVWVVHLFPVENSSVYQNQKAAVPSPFLDCRLLNRFLFACCSSRLAWLLLN